MKNKKLIYGILSAVILFSVLISLSLVLIGLLLYSPSDSSSDSSSDSYCLDLYEQIKKDLDVANYCEIDSDCKVLLLSSGGFGCYRYVNKKIDENETLRISGMVLRYDLKCGGGLLTCEPEVLEPACISEKCVYVKFFF